MATALTLNATEILVNPQHQPQEPSLSANKLKTPLSPDGAGFYNPASPALVENKYSTPVTSKHEPISIHFSTAVITPAAVQQQDTQLSVVPETTDLDFIDSFMNATPKWSSESEFEKAIIRAQQVKREQLLEQRRRDSEMSKALEFRIKDRESHLAVLMADMRRKVKHIDSKKEQLEQFRLDFAETVKERMPSSSSSTTPTPVEKSSLIRMREEQEKKKLLAEWKNSNSEGELQSIRKSILTTQDEVNELNLRIVNLKTELALLHKVAGKAPSSTFSMRMERDKRHEMVMQGVQREVPPPKPEAPYVPPAPRAHLTRMAEAKAEKDAARAARRAASGSSSNFASSSMSRPVLVAKQNP